MHNKLFFPQSTIKNTYCYMHYWKINFSLDTFRKLVIFNIPINVINIPNSYILKQLNTIILRMS